MDLILNLAKMSTSVLVWANSLLYFSKTSFPHIKVGTRKLISRDFCEHEVRSCI